MAKKKEPRANAGSDLRSFVIEADTLHREQHHRGHWRLCAGKACMTAQTEYERRFVVHKET